MLTICLLLLLYSILKKPVADLPDKVRNIKWKEQAGKAWTKITDYSKKAGREASRLVLRFYYTLTDGDLTSTEKAFVYAGIIYIVVPHDLLPEKVLGLIGLVDDAAVATWVFKKVKTHITPAIEQKVNDTLNEWFGYETEISK